MSTKQFWIGFDLGGTKMLTAVYDEALKKTFQIKRKTKPDSHPFSIDRIIDTIEKMLVEWGGKRSSVQGIGIGAPGALNPETGEVVNAPNLGWKNVALRKILEDAFKVPVTVINDVDAGTFGEYSAGAAMNARCVLGVFPGTGIGGSIIYEGTILRGTASSIGEIGHLQIDENGFRCGCGNRGCLETVASRLAIAGQAAIAAYRGQAPALLAATGCDIAKIRSGALAEAIAAGDTIIEEIVRQAARRLGQGIAAAVNLLAPDRIILGGGLVEKMPDLYLSEVSAAMEPGLFPVYRSNGTVAIAQLGADAVTLGAAAHIKQHAEQQHEKEKTSSNPSAS